MQTRKGQKKKERLSELDGMPHYSAKTCWILELLYHG